MHHPLLWTSPVPCPAILPTWQYQGPHCTTSTQCFLRLLQCIPASRRVVGSRASRSRATFSSWEGLLRPGGKISAYPSVPLPESNDHCHPQASTTHRSWMRGNRGSQVMRDGLGARCVFIAARSGISSLSDLVPVYTRRTCTRISTQSVRFSLPSSAPG